MAWKAFWESPNWDYFDKVGIAAALIAMTFSILVWLNQKRKEQRDNTLIYIRLRCHEPSVTITMQGQIRRKNLTRAEIQGMLGMLPMKEKGKRYELAELSRSIFFDEMEEAQINNAVMEVVIPCSAVELQQFDPLKLRELCTVMGEFPAGVN